MFSKLECVCVPTKDIESSISFYSGLGLQEAWRIKRTTQSGTPWTLVGLRFPHEKSSELVLSDNPENQRTEVEILVPDVRRAYEDLSENEAVQWIEKPFATESGHVAVMRAPDDNVFVLVGA